MFVEKLPDFLADFGVAATYGGASILVLFDVPGQDILSDRVSSDQYEITFRTSDMPSLLFGAQIIIAAVAYTVLNVNKIDDGAFSRAVLEAN
jgi:hypothetical protein